jgi:hypothetical protein
LHFFETEQKLGMTLTLHKLGVTTTGGSGHAHLLVAESGGLVALESPEAVMEEVEFRATHVGELLEEMFAEAKRHDAFWEPENN